MVETGDIVAIKKVLQDKRFKNRELQIMRQLVKNPHSNIVALKHCFYSQGEKPEEVSRVEGGRWRASGTNGDGPR